MIQVDGLSLAYHGEPLFEDAIFSIQPGERCSLIGTKWHRQILSYSDC